VKQTCVRTIFLLFLSGITALFNPLYADTTTINRLIREASAVNSENNPDSSLKILKVAERLALASGENKSLAGTYYQIGKSFILKKEYTLAMQRILSADSLYKLLNDTEGIALTNLQLGLLEYSQHNYPDAIPYFKTTIEASKLIGNVKIISTANYLSGLCYLELNELDKAETLLKSSAESKKQMGNEQGYYECKNGLAELEFKKNNFEKSLAIFRECLNYFSTHDNPAGTVISHLGLGKVFLKTNQVDSALIHIRIGNLKSRENNYHDGLLKSALLLSEVYKFTNNYTQAYKFLVDYHLIHDSIYNIDNTRKLARLQYQLSLAQKQIEINDLSRKRAKEKIFLFTLISTTALLIALTIILLRNFRFKQKANRELEKTNEELEQAMKDLKNAQQQLIHSAKLASLGQLTAGVAHELKNPLNFIINFSSYAHELLSEYAEVYNGHPNITIDELKITLDRIQSHGNRANSIITNMMMHARNSDQAKSRTNLSVLLRETIDLAYQGMRASHPAYYCHITIFIPDRDIYAEVIEQEIGRVILNILNNAFYATMKRKESEADYNPKIKISLTPTGKLSKMTIEDNGIGMSEEIRSRIFEPFFTTKPTGEGTGLGLSISYDMVEAHDGDLVVESEHGIFTRFTMTLPMVY
jgi:two-component system NtrC family sensor kinase